MKFLGEGGGDRNAGVWRENLQAIGSHLSKPGLMHTRGSVERLKKNKSSEPINDH